MPLTSLKNFVVLHQGGSSRGVGRGSPPRSSSPHRRSRSLSPSKDLSSGAGVGGGMSSDKPRILPPISTVTMGTRFSHPGRANNPTGTTLASRVAVASNVYSDKTIKASFPPANHNYDKVASTTASTTAAIPVSASASNESIRLKMTHAINNNNNAAITTATGTTNAQKSASKTRATSSRAASKSGASSNNTRNANQELKMTAISLTVKDSSQEKSSAVLPPRKTSPPADKNPQQRPKSRLRESQSRGN